MENKIARIAYLVEQLNTASDAYYGGKGEIMSNYEWDVMFDELEELEDETGHILPNSPTHYISRAKEDDDASNQKEPHEFPALSLAKTKKVEELVSWAEQRDVWVSWKLDGLTLVLTYDNGELSKVLTRGNGITGTNITYFKDCIKGFPLKISDKGHLVVRGEATISYKDFEMINETSEGGEKYANPRNLAAGTLALDPLKKDVVKSRNITFVAFSLIYTETEILSWGKRMDYLDGLGFKTVDRELATSGKLPTVVGAWSEKVENDLVEIPVDGLVICYDDTVYAATGSVTGHHATRAGLAFKWQDQVAVTTLKHVEWSCATSVITPVAVFEPVKLEGTVVSRASLCNISELERLGIGEDGKTTIKIIKANKIIPKCVGVVSKEGCYTVPSECPVCHAETTIVENQTSKTKTLRCSNPRCPAKNLSRFARFASKAGVNVDGLSIRTITTFINKGFLKSFYDIYDLDKYAEDICKTEGFGEKSVSNLIEAIKKSKEVNAVNFIYSLSIPLIGLDAAKRIIGSIGYDEFVARAKNGISFEDISGIGPEKSKTILSWFADGENLYTFDTLSSILNIIKPSPKSENGGSCSGLTFVITGSLESFKNRDELVSFIEERGGKVSSAVSASTSYLINNSLESKSSKNEKARKLGITIISEQDFLSKFS